MHNYYYYYYLLRVWMGEQYLGARGGGSWGRGRRYGALPGWVAAFPLVGMGALDARKEGFLEMGNYFFNLRDEWRGGGEGTGGYFV